MSPAERPAQPVTTPVSVAEEEAMTGWSKVTSCTSPARTPTKLGNFSPPVTLRWEIVWPAPSKTSG